MIGYYVWFNHTIHRYAFTRQHVKPTNDPTWEWVGHTDHGVFAQAYLQEGGPDYYKVGEKIA
jgi:hypothetical protein